MSHESSNWFISSFELPLEQFGFYDRLIPENTGMTQRFGVLKEDSFSYGLFAVTIQPPGHSIIQFVASFMFVFNIFGPATLLSSFTLATLMRDISSSGWQLFSLEKKYTNPDSRQTEKLSWRRECNIWQMKRCFSSDVTGHKHNSLYCYNDVAQCVVWHTLAICLDQGNHVSMLSL